MESRRLSVAGSQSSAGVLRRRILLLSCHWPEAENLGGLGVEPPRVGAEDLSPAQPPDRRFSPARPRSFTPLRSVQDDKRNVTIRPDPCHTSFAANTLYPWRGPCLPHGGYRREGPGGFKMLLASVRNGHVCATVQKVKHLAAEKSFIPLGTRSYAIWGPRPRTEFRHDSCNTAPR